MARRLRDGSFLPGLAGGVVVGFALLLTPILWLGMQGLVELYAPAWTLIEGVWALAETNLKGSVFPFLLILIAYWVQLEKLRKLLYRANPPLEKVVRHEQLLELCANLFFGVGVIWTAVGMRDALLYALGDPGVTATEGAFAILQRLVDGGILLALSTTIVGGVGGYLMRAIKSVALGQALNARYCRASQEPVEENLATLQRIEGLLQPGKHERDRTSL